MPLEDLLQIVGAAMQSPDALQADLASRRQEIIMTARIAGLISVISFVLIWSYVERGLWRERQNTGSLSFGFLQLLRVYVLTILIGSLIDGNLLAAFFGNPDPLLTIQVIDVVRSTPLPDPRDLAAISYEDEATILAAITNYARTTLLHGWALLGCAIGLVAALASGRVPALTPAQSDWVGLAVLLGLLGWPGATDGAALAALDGDIAPLLSRLMGVSYAPG